MAAEVIKPLQFNRGSTATTDALAEDLEAATDPTTIEELPLAEPQYGDEHLGTLTDDEADLFVQFFNASNEAEHLNRTVGGGLMVAMGNDIRTGTAKPSQSEEDHAFKVRSMLDPVEMRDLFRVSQKAQTLKAQLFWQLGERFDCHDYSMAIRTKRRVVKRARKW